MSFRAINHLNYGQDIEIVFLDVDTKKAADLSGYTVAQEMIFVRPNNTKVTKAAAFKSNGTDGVIKYTIDQGLFVPGNNWTILGVVRSTSAQLATLPHTFAVF